MSLLNGVFTIDASVDNAGLIVIAKELFSSLGSIQEVQLDTKNSVTSSAVFSLLVSVKKSAPHIRIALLEDGAVDIEGIGAVLLDMRG